MRSPQKNPLDCTTSDTRIIDNFILADEVLAKALQRFATCLSCLLVRNILPGKLGDLSARVSVSSFSIPTKFDDSFIPVSFLMLILIY